MTGKDVYINMQNIDEQLIIEATDIKATKKKFYFTERQRDNLATAAIVCLVVAAVLLVPTIVKHVTGDGFSPAGVVESTVSSETAAQDETASMQETSSELAVNYDNVPDGAKVIDGVLYEYSTWLERYVVSDWSLPGESAVLNDVSGLTMTSVLSKAISNNAIITESNADIMYYAVEIAAKNQLNASQQANAATELYLSLADIGNYGIRLAEAGNYKSNYGDFFVSHDAFVYGLLTYDEMKELAVKYAQKNSGNGLKYDLISEFEVQKANIYTDNMVPKYSKEELSAAWRYVYSPQYEKYIVSRNYLQTGDYYNDHYTRPTKDTRVTYSSNLKSIMDSNAIINVNNAGSMTYLVEINVYDVSSQSGDPHYDKILSAFGDEVKDDVLKKEYERLKSACNYDIRLGEQFWGTGNNTPVIYGMLTYEQMKTIPVNEAYGYAFQIAGETDFGPSGIIEESLYGKGYTVIDTNTNNDNNTKTE